MKTMKKVIFALTGLFFFWGSLSIYSAWLNNSHGEMCQWIDTPTKYSIHDSSGDLCVLTMEPFKMVLVVFLLWLLTISLFMSVSKRRKKRASMQKNKGSLYETDI